RTRRRHGGDSVSLVQHLVRCHDVVAQEAYVVDHTFGQVNDAARGLCQISRGDDGMDPWNFRSVPGINGFNTSMGVGTAQDLAMEQTRQPYVSSIGSTTRDFLSAVVADGPCTNDVVFLVGEHDVWLVRVHRGPAACSV